MAERKQSSFDGQNSDGGMKDSLEPMNPQQKDPYKAKASEFPVKKISAGHGQSEDSSDSSLISWAGNLTSPREVEIPGKGGSGSDSMATRASAVSSNFSVGTSSGESGVAPVAPGNEYGVDLSTGRVTCSSYKGTKVKEVAEDSVSIG